MDSTTPDLQSLAKHTNEVLAKLWDEIGVQEEERSLFLSNLRKEVELIYERSVSGQEHRKSCLQEEIQSLQTTVDNLQNAVEEKTGYVRAEKGKTRAPLQL